MFALTCPHCKTEIQTKFARPGATVKCVKCQKTFLLDARNTREILEGPKVALMGPHGEARPLVSPVAGESLSGNSGSHQSSSKAAMAAMREMTEQMGELAPEVDIYAAAPSAAPHGSHTVKVILATALLIAVLTGAIWVLFAAGIIGGKTETAAKPAAPAAGAPAAPPQKPVPRRPDGTLPAQEF